jgi:aminopeptidase N
MRLLIMVIIAIAVLSTANAVPRALRSGADFQRPEIQKAGRHHALDADSTHSYDQIALSLDYRVEDGAVPATGHAVLTLVARQPITLIPLNAEGITIVQVTENSGPVAFTHPGDTLYIARNAQTNDTVRLDIQVSVPARLYQLGYNYHGTHVCTMAEPYGARRWFPCFDQPFDKFSDLTVAVDMPDYWELASNGVEIEISYPSTGRKREVYHLGHPISSYLVMMAAGDYSRFYQTVNNVEYRYFAFPWNITDALYDWQRTPQMIAVFDSLFGPYPFNEYGMVEAAIGGAMEHQTFTTIDPQFITGDRQFEDVVAHELSHQWFGDDVTCVDFRNIWLNEGFATYCASLFYEAVEGEDVFQSRVTADQQISINEDQHYLRYPIYAPPDSLTFGANEYNKGAAVLHMLREQIMGDSVFFAGLRHYVALYAGGNVSTDDFSNAMSDVYGEDLHWFFEQWVYQAGYPIIEYTIEPGVPTASDVTVFVRQTQYDPTRNTPYFRFPLLLDVQTAGGTVTRQFWFNAQESQSVTMNFSSEVQNASLTSPQPLLYTGNPVGVSPLPPEVANKFALGAIYPNPFNSVTRIPFEIEKTGNVRMDVFDLTGRCVQTLLAGRVTAGQHEIEFAAPRSIATGLYLIALESNGSRRITKAMYIK